MTDLTVRSNLQTYLEAQVGAANDLRAELIESYDEQQRLRARVKKVEGDVRKLRSKLETSEHRLENLRKSPLGRWQVAYWQRRKRSSAPQ